MSKEDIERIMKAREAVCPSIILTFFNSNHGFSEGTIVIDYLEKQYPKKSRVIADCLTHGNNTDKLKIYGSEFTFDQNNPEFHVNYYFDVSSYLIDPILNAPYNSRASSYREINLDNRQDLRNILILFQSFLERQEQEMERMESEESHPFVYEEFTTPNEVNEILNRNAPIRSFDEIINHTQYFNTDLF